MIQGIVTKLYDSEGNTHYYIIEGLLRKVNKKGDYLTTKITQSQFYELQKAGYIYIYNEDFEYFSKEIKKLKKKLAK